PRVIQGFVTQLHESSDIDPCRLKAIDQVLDLIPPLTPELVELSRWMSRRYVCHEITAMQAMIPGALKAKYERIISIHADENLTPDEQFMKYTPDEQFIMNYMEQNSPVSLEWLSKHCTGKELAIKALIRRGILSEKQTVRD